MTEQPQQPQQSGQPPQPPAAPPPYGGYPVPGWQPPPDHPQSTVVLVLGILGLVACQVLSPVAWVMGNRALVEIDGAGGTLGGRGAVQAGRICGIVGTCLLVLAVVMLIFFLVMFLVFGVAILGTAGTSGTTG